MMEKPIKDQEQLEVEEKIATEDLITEVAIPKELATEVPLSVADGTDRYPDVYQTYSPDKIVQATRKGNRFIFVCENKITFRISILESGLFQLTYSHDGFFHPEFSYALDPKFQPAEIDPAFFEKKDYYMIRTQKLICLIQKKKATIKFTDLEGNLINEDKTGFFAKTTILKGVDRVRITKKALTDERFLGFGDKTKPNNLRGHQFINWNSDAFSYDQDTDPLYRTIPFYYGIHEKGAYGIFFDNTYKSTFDFDSEKDDTVSFTAEGGEANYYFIYDSTPTEIAKTYTRLTGTPELAPMWGLGFHQCRWSYYPEKRVRNLANKFRSKNIPCDAIYLDIDYMDQYRIFTWNYDYFPNPEKLLSDLQADGFQTVVMIDPGIRVDPNNPVYQDGLEKEMYCRMPDGRLMTGPVWPPVCAFPDYTNPKVREWWGPLYRDLYVNAGVAGFWNDMNEPAVFKVDAKTFPGNVMHDYEGRPTDHNKAHNIYGMQMARATFEGLKGLKPEKRPLVITRATYSGGQRFSSVWTGDNRSTWNHLRLANVQCQRLSISGFSYVGTDIGGFHGDPDGELMTRWLQLGIFHPLYRIHSMGSNVDGAAIISGYVIKEEEQLWQEPWTYGDEFTVHTRKAIETRYQLLGYLYTAFRKYCQDGTPLMRPLAFEYPSTKNADRPEFIWGDDLLVGPVLEQGIRAHLVQLPEGDWYDLFSGKKYAGNQLLQMDVDQSSIPIFAKPGSVIPFYPVRQHTGEKITDSVTLKIFYTDGKYQSSLYEDQGEGYGYKNEVYSDKTFYVENYNDTFLISQNIQGIYSGDYKAYTLEIYGCPFHVDQIKVDGAVTDFYSEEKTTGQVIILKVNEKFGEVEILKTT